MKKHEFLENLILNTDSYKTSHYLQFPEGTTGMYSYLESRWGEYQETVFFGLQYIMERYLTTPVTMEMVDYAEIFCKAHGVPFNREGWEYIAKDLNGKLPIQIKAVPEGTVVPIKNVLMTVESTDPKVYWLVTYLETLLMRVWYPITVATISHHCKGIILDALNKSSDVPEAEIDFKLHDFGSRGVSSMESAGIGGAAHLVNFKGSDTMSGVLLANMYYPDANSHGGMMSGFSIPAAEHTTVIAWGKDNESKAYANMLKQFAKPGSLLAVVSDSYDLYNAIENIWGNELKQAVIDSGATIIIRPDSGDPKTVVLKTCQLLNDKFGSTVNTKGYKVLNNVRVIQGDGINANSITEILNHLLDHGYSASNIAFGMGGALLQQCNRDTQGFAYKCSQVTVNGTDVDVCKTPKTDLNKSSKKGRLKLIKDASGHFMTTNNAYLKDELYVVYLNGEITKKYSLQDVRNNAIVK